MENKQEHDIVYLSDFFPQEKQGSLAGNCVLCSRATKQGLPIDFSEKFTNWSQLQQGDCLCPACYELARNQDYRRKNWVADKEGVKFLSREQIAPMLENPPEPPFGIYLTRTFKKQGFLQLITKVAANKDHYFLAFDDGLIYVDMFLLKEMKAFAEQMRQKGFTKTELETGNLKVKKNIWISVQMYEQAQKYKGSPLWGVVVYAVE